MNMTVISILTGSPLRWLEHAAPLEGRWQSAHTEKKTVRGLFSGGCGEKRARSLNREDDVQGLSGAN